MTKVFSTIILAIFFWSLNASASGLCDWLLAKFHHSRQQSETSYATTVERRFRQKESTRLLKTAGKIKEVSFESRRHRLFEKNERAARSLLSEQQVLFDTVEQTKSMAASGLKILVDGTARLNQQALAINRITGYSLLYSPKFPWLERARSLFKVAAPEAGIRRDASRIYATPHMVIQGKLTHWEKHEVDHAILTSLEDRGLFTGPTWLKLRVDANGANTGIPSYPKSIDFQELYTFADQLYELSRGLEVLQPNTPYATELLKLADQLTNVYLSIIVNLQRHAKKALELMNQNSVDQLSLSFRQISTQDPREALFFEYLKQTYLIWPTNYLSSSNAKNKELIVKQLQRQLETIVKTAEKSHASLSDVINNRNQPSIDPNSNEWSASFLENLRKSKAFWFENLPDSSKSVIDEWDQIF